MIESPPLALAALILVARIALALVFAVAGLAKLRDLGGTQTMLREFGLAAPIAGPFARALPLIELAVAFALLPSATASIGVGAALALLCAFTVAIGVSLASGRKPECRCFGQVAAVPIGASTLARNLALLGVAALIALAGAERADSLVLTWIGDHLGWVVAATTLFGLLALQTLLMLQMLRQQGRLLLRLELLEGVAHPGGFAAPPPLTGGLQLGALAPNFELPDLDGARRSLTAFVEGGQRVALFFAHPACGPCGALLPQIAAWQRELADQLTVVIISEGDIGENRAVFAEHDLHNVLLQSEHAVSDAYQAWGTPSALIIGADGRIGSGVGAGADAIHAIIAAATEDAYALSSLVPA